MYLSSPNGGKPLAELIWVPNPPDLPKFLKEIPGLGVPSKVNRAYLKSVGFTSSNHSYIPRVLLKLGFLDSSGAPTDRWKRYRDKTQQATVMQEALLEAYKDLYATFPDAHNRDVEALRNYFGSRSDAAGVTLVRAANTFKTLSGLARFNSTAPGTPQTPSDAAATIPAGGGSPPTPTPHMAMPAVNINIQLQLPETDKKEVYDNFFAAMRKHLFE